MSRVVVQRRVNVLAELCAGATVVWLGSAARCSACRRRVHRRTSTSSWRHVANREDR